MKASRVKIYAFTLIELLVVMLIIGVLVAIILPSLWKTKFTSQRNACLSNMRQLGIAFQLYAGEHNMELPGRVEVGDKWPGLLHEYAKATKVFLAPGIDPGPMEESELRNTQKNNTSFIMNGYNDVVGGIPLPTDRFLTVNIPAPSQTLLLGMSKNKDNNFYMDFSEGVGNQNTALNLVAYDDGANYVFADGSARFIKKVDYDDKLWLTDKNTPVPTPPGN